MLMLVKGSVSSNITERRKSGNFTGANVKGKRRLRFVWWRLGSYKHILNNQGKLPHKQNHAAEDKLRETLGAMGLLLF